jgi:hypothetical protein
MYIIGEISESQIIEVELCCLTFWPLGSVYHLHVIDTDITRLSLCRGILRIEVPLSCGVLMSSVYAEHLASYFSGFSDKGSLKASKLLACYSLKFFSLNFVVRAL